MSRRQNEMKAADYVTDQRGKLAAPTGCFCHTLSLLSSLVSDFPEPSEGEEKKFTLKYLFCFVFRLKTKVK